MKGKIISILVMTLLIASCVLPVTGTIKSTEYTNPTNYDETLLQDEHGYAYAKTGGGRRIDGDMENNPLPDEYKDKWISSVYNVMMPTATHIDTLCNDLYGYFSGDPPGDFLGGDYYHFKYIVCKGSGCHKESHFMVNIALTGLDIVSYQNRIVGVSGHAGMECPDCHNKGFNIYGCDPVNEYALSSDLKNDIITLEDLLNSLVGHTVTFKSFPWPSTPEWVVPFINEHLDPNAWPIVVLNYPVCLDDEYEEIHYTYKWNKPFTIPSNTWSYAQCAPVFTCDSDYPDYYHQNVEDTFYYYIYDLISTRTNPYFIYSITPNGHMWRGVDYTVGPNLPPTVPDSGGYWRQCCWEIWNKDGPTYINTFIPNYKITDLDSWYNITVHYCWETLMSPEVYSITPTGDDVSTTNSPIKVRFDVDMDFASVESAFSIDPPIPGATFNWIDSKEFWYGCAPDYNLDPEVRYYINIGTDAKDISGNKMSTRYTWNFKANPYRIDPPYPDYRICADTPWAGEVIDASQGGGRSLNVNVSSYYEFDEPVYLDLHGLPQGSEYSFTTNPVYPNQEQTVTSQLNILIPENADLGRYKLTLTGIGGDIEQNAPIHLIVTKAPQPAPDPPEVTVQVHASLCYKPNTPPDKPKINGPRIGATGVNYSYKLTTTDEETEQIYYKIDWGDGEIYGWYGPYESGAICELKHSWVEIGNYQIRVKAIDTNGEAGPEGTFTVIMPRDKSIQNTMLLRFFEQFPLLGRLFQSLRFQ